MKRFVKHICLLLALSLLLAVPAMAAEVLDGRASNFFGSSRVYLYKTSSFIFEFLLTKATILSCTRSK